MAIGSAIFLMQRDGGDDRPLHQEIEVSLLSRRPVIAIKLVSPAVRSHTKSDQRGGTVPIWNLRTQMTYELEHLIRPENMVSYSEVFARPSVIPAQPGVYAWYFDQSPSSQIDVEACWRWQGRHLLYVGISPGRPPKNGKPPSSQNLQMRVKYHLIGNAEGSTLRLTLGCLLADTLGIELRRVGSGRRMTFSTGEQALSNWINQHARVAWITHPAPWTVEEAAIEQLYLPLNLDQNSGHPFHTTLSAARRQARARARELPIVPK